MIKVIGIGEAGRKAIAELQGGTFSVIGIDTDSNVELLNEEYFFGENGAGGQREIASELINSDIERVKNIVSDSTKIILVAGLAGGTGSGATPIVAKIAKETGAEVHIIGIFPFNYEGSRKTSCSETSLKELETLGCNISIYDNTKLSKEFSGITKISDFLAAINAKIRDEIISLVK